MQKANVTGASDASMTRPANPDLRKGPEPPRVLLRVEIASKLGFGPSEHRSSKPWANAEEAPVKRARARRRHI
jgi:hypothetical protein